MNEYRLSDSERQHAANVQSALNDFQNEICRLEGVIRLKERQMEFLRRHLSMWLGTMAEGAGLPMGSRLSPDGAALIGRAETVNG